MNDTDHTRELLQRRAERLAQRRDAATARRVIERVLVVEIGRERVGIGINHLREVVAAAPVTPLVGVPEAVEGVGSLRGELVAVADLARLLGRTSTPAASGDGGPSGRSWVVVESGQRALALRIDSVVGLRDLFEGELAPDLGQGDGGGLVRAVTDDLVSLLDVERLLSSERLLSARARATQGRAARGE